MKIRLLALLVCLCAGFVTTAQTVPTPDHVVVVVMENHGYSEIIGSNTGAPYINSLAVDTDAALFTNSLAITHPSQPNYLYLFSGNSQGVLGDLTLASFQLPLTTANLGAELINAGRTFKGFSEDLPSVGFTGDTYNNYARKHAPWVNWQGNSTNGISATLAQPFDSFPSNFNNLPTLCWVIPNLNDDMHNGTIAQGDTWLQTHLDAYVQWAKSHNSLLILTYDEDENSVGNSTPITTIFVGQMVKAGTYPESIDHNRVLRTMEEMYGLGHAGASSTPAPITDCWIYKPVSALGATPRSICLGHSTQVTVVDSSLNTPTRWWWSFPGGSPSSATGQNPPAVTYSSPGTYNMTLITNNHMGYDTVIKTGYITVTAPPVITVSDSVSICSGSNAVITASGATNYTWLPATGVVSTNNNVLTADPTSYTVYSVTGSTNGCPGDTAHTRVFVNPVVTPSVSIQTTPGLTVCANEMITHQAIVVSGGSHPSYQWILNGVLAGNSATFTQMEAGSYSIQCILTSNAPCATHSTDTSAAVQITVNPSPVEYVTDTFCAGASYAFHGQQLNAPGTYYDTLSTVHGCDSVTRLFLTQRQAIGSFTNISICTGDSYSFNGRTLSSAGLYTDTLASAIGCDSVASVQLAVDSLPQVLWTGSSDTIYTGSGPVALTGGSPTGGTFSGTGVSGNTFYPDSVGPGTYVLNYTYSYGSNCSNSAQKTFIVVATGINNIIDIAGITLYPNPVKNELILTCPNADISQLQPKVFDAMGRMMQTPVSIQNNGVMLNTRSLAGGMYYIKGSVQGVSFVRKFVKSE